MTKPFVTKISYVTKINKDQATLTFIGKLPNYWKTHPTKSYEYLISFLQNRKNFWMSFPRFAYKGYVILPKTMPATIIVIEKNFFSCFLTGIFSVLIDSSYAEVQDLLTTKLLEYFK